MVQLAIRRQSEDFALGELGGGHFLTEARKSLSFLDLMRVVGTRANIKA